MFLIPFDEMPGDSWIMKYWHILSDTAHLSVELTLTIVIDVLLLGLAWPAFKRFVNARLEAQHAQLDEEHGIQHHDDHIHVDPELRKKLGEHEC